MCTNTSGLSAQITSQARSTAVYYAPRLPARVQLSTRQRMHAILERQLRAQHPELPGAQDGDEDQTRFNNSLCSNDMYISTTMAMTQGAQGARGDGVKGPNALCEPCAAQRLSVVVVVVCVCERGGA